MKTLLAALLLLLSAHSAHADGVGNLTGVGRHATAGGCSQATTFLARTSGLDATHTNAYTTLICGMVTDGTWCGSLFDAIYVLATQDSTTALLNLCAASKNLTANGSPTFTADAGFTGVDSSISVYLDPGVALNTYTNYTLNSAHLSAWSLTNAASTSGGGNVTGAADASFTTSALLTARYSDDKAYCSVNDDTTSDPGAANANSTGWHVCDRTNSTTSTLYRNGSVVYSPNLTSISVSSSHLGILAAGLPTQFFSGSALQIAAATAGAHLSSANVTSVYNRLCTFLTTVHGSC